LPVLRDLRPSAGGTQRVRIRDVCMYSPVNSARLKDFVPPEYQKTKKDIDKRIFQEHRKLQGMSELNAKFRYVQLCRSLKTYGVTFFLVKVSCTERYFCPSILPTE
jgi:hypothetical protein